MEMNEFLLSDTQNGVSECHVALQAREARVSPPALSGRRVCLRPYQEDDASILYRWISNPAELYLWRNRRSLPPFELFCHELHESLQQDLAHLIIEGKASHKPVGWVFAYDYQPIDQHCFLATYTIPEARRFGAAAEGGLLFLDYLFAYFPLHKVSMEVYAFNTASLNVAIKAGFQVEGTLREEYYFGGQFHDIVRLGLLATEWVKIRTLLNVDQLSNLIQSSVM